MKKLLALLMIVITVTTIAFDKKSKFIISETETTSEIYGKELKTLNGHRDFVYSVSYSPDGKYLASGSDDNIIKIWDVFTGKEIKTFTGHRNGVNSVNYNPTGKYLASGSNDKTIKIWDVATGEEIKTLIGHSGGINSLSYNPDGKYLASGSNDKTIKIWDVSTGKEIKTLSGHSDGVKSIMYSPDGKYLASGSWDSTIKIWDVSSGKEVKTFNSYYSILSVSYSPDGKYLASGSVDSTIKIWDVSTGKEVKYLKGHGNSVYSVSYSPDGKYLASGSTDSTINIWDVSTGKKIISLTEHRNAVHSVSYSLDGKYLASGSTDNTIKIWKMQYTVSKARTKVNVTVNNQEGEVIGALPQNMVSDVRADTMKIYKPLLGTISITDFELLYNNNENTKLYTVNNTPIYVDIGEKKVFTNIEKGKIIDKLYYSFHLDMYYIENRNIKGWIESDNIGLLQNRYNKLAIVENNTDAYNSINGIKKNTYNSGDILDITSEEEEKGYFCSDKVGWIPKKSVMLIDESEKGKRIFSNKKEVKFNSDLIGNNYKNVSIGTEYRLLGATEKYYLVESNSTGEKGWIAKTDMSFVKPDLNDPTIIITDTIVDENNMLIIKGKIYDDTEIKSFLLNGNKMTTKPLNSFDKISYVPEVGYSFSSQWFLIEGMENNVEIKVIDRDGKTYSKVLQYTPELKTVNLNEFQIENIVKQIPKLEYAINLKDENGDGILTGSEKISLIVTVKNIGEGEAKNVNVKIMNPSSSGVSYKNTYPMGIIMANETKTAVIEFTGKEGIIIGKALFDLTVEEANGFNPFPAKFSFNTEPKLNPKLEILDYAIDDENKNGQIEQGEKFDLYVLIQNTGDGDSKNTIFEALKKDEGIINMSESNFKYDIFKSGESKKVKMSFVTNYKYKGNGDLPFTLNLYGESDKTKTEKSIVLTMNKAVPTIKEVNLEGKKIDKKIELAKNISLISDVDVFVSNLTPKKENPKKWAVVVGVEEYRKTLPVEFAERDALVTKDYFNKLLGVPKENTFYLSNNNATYGEFKVLLKNTLKNRVNKGDEVYFYFSGHGVPTNEGETYLLLNDSDPSNPELTAYSVKELYKDLGTLPSSKSYAFLDSCFAGGSGRAEVVETLLSGTRPGVLMVNDVSLSYDNLVVYNATDKNQLSNSYKDQGHGLFTYYLLKGLSGAGDKNSDKKLEVKELQDYLEKNVSDTSRKLFGETRYQKPLLKTKVNNMDTLY